MFFAVCGQNVRKVIKKKYAAGDLATKETQVSEIELDEDMNLPPQPKPTPRAKPKVYIGLEEACARALMEETRCMSSWRRSMKDAIVEVMLEELRGEG
jgi:hypothetical protein